MADDTNNNNASSQSKTVIVSAPGKILLVGGYLILEESNPGLVIAVNRRFYCRCSVSIASLSSATTTTTIVVESPQLPACWQYTFNDNNNSALMADPSNSSQNVFIETALTVVLRYLHYSKTTSSTMNHLFYYNIRISLCGDNDFYSLVSHLQAAQLELDEGDQLAKCLPIVGSHKTGLGSSACLTTALVGSLLHAFNHYTDGNVMCGLAQLAHCIAQGKIGSGFDVSAALYGSHVYKRFAKTVLEPYLTTHNNNSTDYSSLLSSSLLNGVQSPVTFSDHSLLQVMMADVTGGSESPSMARQVLEWKTKRQTDHDENHVWKQLEILNPQICDMFVEIQTTSDASKIPQLQQLFAKYRTLLKRMGDEAGVPIEPDPQTALCDATCQINGVVTCLVPGAGGYDAIVAVYQNNTHVHHTIAQFWATQKVCALTVSGVSYGDGLRLEESFPL